ncbi:hypothetical protein E4U27_000600 [Claviceps purpurea]|nr:hypothetical protein E4U27_000600 [Claviceps purpurea]
MVWRLVPAPIRIRAYQGLAYLGAHVRRFHQYAITNALGKACYDGRLITGSNYDEARGDFFGPFVDEDDFNDTLRCGALPNALFITKLHRRWLRIVDAVFEKLSNFEAELAVERQLWWYCY